MKTIKTLLLGTIIGLSSLPAYSQSSPTYPAPSPAASVSQTFGITKVEINYSSPGVKGRQIWGGLVPYDSVWRTGANACTNISFSTDVMVGGVKVKKGKYGLFTIPKKGDLWTVILNSDADQWGAYNYKISLDIVRFSALVRQSDMNERMSFTIDPTSDSIATITFRWEKLKFSFQVIADTKGMVKKSIEDFANSDWRTYANAANYYADNNLDLKKAEDWAQMSVNMKETYSNCYVLAKILHMEGDNKESMKYAEEAKTMGDKANDEPYQNNYKDKIAKLIADLSASMPAENKKKK